MELPLTDLLTGSGKTITELPLTLLQQQSQNNHGIAFNNWTARQTTDYRLPTATFMQRGSVWAIYVLAFMQRGSVWAIYVLAFMQRGSVWAIYVLIWWMA